MSAFVLDASTAISWCFQESDTSYTRAVADALARGAEVYVPHVWPLEVTNVLLKFLRQRKITREEFDEYLRQLETLGVRVDSEEVADRAFGTTLALAIRHQLTSYDASYLELARRLSLPMATADRNLLQAARQTRTPLFAPEGASPLQ